MLGCGAGLVEVRCGLDAAATRCRWELGAVRPDLLLGCGAELVEIRCGLDAAAGCCLWEFGAVRTGLLVGAMRGGCRLLGW